MGSAKCPVCKIDVSHWQSGYQDRLITHCDCPNCGSYLITDEARVELDGFDKKTLAVLSHGIWQGQKPGAPFFVSCVVLRSIKESSLPDPAEQLNQFILLLGRHQKSVGNTISANPEALRAKIGAIDAKDVEYICHAAEQGRLIEKYQMPPAACGGRLTMLGWQRFHKLERGAVHSKTAFMAMPFGNETITQMVNKVFRDAVAETGFTLKPVSDMPRAGLIDDHIRVDIRLCRFLIADLTCENRGAYWEAGYAEGLGKPVIYTCNKNYFESQGTHFDTNHHQTVVWDPADPTRAAEDLKATIRATLPFEAVMPKE